MTTLNTKHKTGIDINTPPNTGGGHDNDASNNPPGPETDEDKGLKVAVPSDLGEELAVSPHNTQPRSQGVPTPSLDQVSTDGDFANHCPHVPPSLDVASNLDRKVTASNSDEDSVRNHHDALQLSYKTPGSDEDEVLKSCPSDSPGDEKQNTRNATTTPYQVPNQGPGDTSHNSVESEDKGIVFKNKGDIGDSLRHGEGHNITLPRTSLKKPPRQGDATGSDDSKREFSTRHNASGTESPESQPHYFSLAKQAVDLTVGSIVHVYARVVPSSGNLESNTGTQTSEKGISSISEGPTIMSSSPIMSQSQQVIEGPEMILQTYLQLEEDGPFDPDEFHLLGGESRRLCPSSLGVFFKWYKPHGYKKKSPRERHRHPARNPHVAPSISHARVLSPPGPFHLQALPLAEMRRESSWTRHVVSPYGPVITQPSFWRGFQQPEYIYAVYYLA